MTREEFLDWATAQEVRYEFDGFQPVAMTGGIRDHSQICQNIYYALRTRPDRIDKLREYHAVRSIRRYVILEHTSVGLAVHSRSTG